MFGWIKVDGYSYIGRIFNIDNNRRVCCVELDTIIFYDVPFSEIQAPNGLSLPWDK